MDLLHNKIRKLKNPSMVDFGIKASCIPPHILAESADFVCAYGRFCRELLEKLKDTVPAVRFSMGDFALLGAQGLQLLQEFLIYAGELGYYVALDAPSVNSPWEADKASQALFVQGQFPCDAVIVSPYIGSDAIKPFALACKESEKALFVILRSANKSAADLQDLITGSRHVHQATADIVNRFGENLLCRCGYTRIGAVVSAGAASSVRNLRNAHKSMYFLVDGLDYPSGNFKNCSYAFDRFGFGAVVCAGPSVTAAWKEVQSDGTDYLDHALAAAERMKKNLSRYITVM